MPANRIEVVSAGVVVADHLCEPIDHMPEPGELIMSNRLVLEIGGCATNVGVDLAKMGVPCTVAGCVGRDTFGDFIRRTLEARGVGTSGIRTLPQADTSQTLIVNVQGEDRRFIHTFGANAHFTAEHISPELLGNTRVLYVGGFVLMPALTQEALANVFRKARERNVITMLDVAIPGRLGQSDLLNQLHVVLPHTDVFLPNEDEGRLITGQSDPVAQCEVLRDAGAGTVVITRGGSGAVLCGDGIRLRAESFPVDFVDGSGGGDAFDAGYISGLLRGYGPRKCLEIASALGASSVRAVGTTPGVFTREECDSFLERHTLQITEI